MEEFSMIAIFIIIHQMEKGNKYFQH